MAGGLHDDLAAQPDDTRLVSRDAGTVGDALPRHPVQRGGLM
ncbi:hypothetical protein [Streptomyces sp. NPDC056948]